MPRTTASPEIERSPVVRLKAYWSGWWSNFNALMGVDKPWWKCWWRNANCQFGILALTIVFIDVTSVLHGAGGEVYRASALIFYAAWASVVGLASIVILWFSPPLPPKIKGPKSALGGFAGPLWRLVVGGALLAVGAVLGFTLQMDSEWYARQAPAGQPELQYKFAAQGVYYSLGVVARAVLAAAFFTTAAAFTHGMVMTPAVSRFRACVTAPRHLKLWRPAFSCRWIHEVANPFSVFFAWFALAVIVGTTYW